jgi:four helix bundle protein
MVDRQAEKVNGFETLLAWQKSQDLAVEIYSILRLLPDNEEFGLKSQLRRASASISANIAEGYGRSSSKDRANFLSIANGSLLETKNFIYLAERLEYIDQQTTSELLDLATSCQRLIHGYRKSVLS